MSLDVSLKHTEYMFFCKKNVIFCISSKNFPSYSAVPNSSRQQWVDCSSIPLLTFSIGIYILPSYILIYFLHAAIYFAHCALSLIILFYICACCDTLCSKNVCLFLFVEVKALLGLCYMLYNTRHKIKFRCLCLLCLCFDARY